jgi:hypothetical protein
MGGSYRLKGLSGQFAAVAILLFGPAASLTDEPTVVLSGGRAGASTA